MSTQFGDWPISQQLIGNQKSAIGNVSGCRYSIHRVDFA
jgi:hypothetical protein